VEGFIFEGLPEVSGAEAEGVFPSPEEFITLFVLAELSAKLRCWVSWLSTVGVEEPEVSGAPAAEATADADEPSVAVAIKDTDPFEAVMLRAVEAVVVSLMRPRASVMPIAAFEPIAALPAVVGADPL
jgi:hypothetical protein